ncbi:MAG: hypothetical protein GY801_52475 [bacterium]|nr:hypothetical protein [bacterium]
MTVGREITIAESFRGNPASQVRQSHLPLVPSSNRKAGVPPDTLIEGQDRDTLTLGVNRLDAVSWHVPPRRYRLNAPSASLPERGIGIAGTFTLQDT